MGRARGTAGAASAAALGILLAALPCLTPPLAAQVELAPADEVTTVVVVRHAEKAEGEDPPLTEEGRERARALARTLSAAGLEAAYATQWRRTQETVAPAAEAAELEVRVVDAAAVEALATRLRREHSGQVVLVAGHSNTVTRLVHALGGPAWPELSEDAYDDLFLVTLRCEGGAAAVRLRYGPPSAPHGS